MSPFSPEELPPMQRLIVETWNRLKSKILANPDELAKRLKRCKGKAYSRPPRPWCLAVRASDRRIGVVNGRIEPEYATDPGDPEHFGRLVEHSVTLTSALLRELELPVRLNADGELWDDAARKLGVTIFGLLGARITGTLRTRHVRGYRGRHGPPVPFVSGDELLDPCAARGLEMQNALWVGCEHVSARIPGGFEQTVTRMPVYQPVPRRHQYDPTAHPEMAEAPPPRKRRRLPKPEPDFVWYKWSTSNEFLGEDSKYWRKSPDDPGTPPPTGAISGKSKSRHRPKPSRASGSLRFHGWMWKCPTCSRAVRMLYLPLPPRCVLEDAIVSADRVGSDGVPTDRKSQIANRESNAFACYGCHRVVDFCQIGPCSWNMLVTYLSGGLLYGKEVPRPAWYRESARRKKRFFPRVHYAAPRKEQILALFRRGLGLTAMAREIGIPRTRVQSLLARACRQHGVPDRFALARKLGVTHPQDPTPPVLARRRRERVRPLLLAGLSFRQIAAELGLTPARIDADARRIYREHGVKNRKELIGKSHALAA